MQIDVIIDLTFMLVRLVLTVGLILLGFIGMMIVIVNHAISDLELYYTPKTRQNEIGEPFGVRCLRVLTSYTILTLPLFTAIVISLKFSGITELAPIYLTAMIGTPVILIGVRLLLNPTERLSIRYTRGEVDLFRERIHSLFFSYISITWIIFILSILEKTALGVTFETILGNFVMKPDMESFISITSGYVISLIILTIVSEAILMRLSPIVQVPWSTRD